MLDRAAITLLRPLLDRAGAALHRLGIQADTVTWAGFAIGVAAAVAIHRRRRNRGRGLGTEFDGPDLAAAPLVLGPQQVEELLTSLEHDEEDAYVLDNTSIDDEDDIDEAGVDKEDIDDVLLTEASHVLADVLLQKEQRYAVHNDEPLLN